MMRKRLGGALGLLLLTAASVQAQSRVGVREFAGPQSERARSALVRALESDGATVVGEDDISGAASGEDLKSDQGRAAAARKLGLAALVEGNVKKRGRQLEVSIRVYDGGTGQELARGSTRTRPQQLARRVRTLFTEDLRGALSGASAPEAAPEPEPEPKPEPEPVAEEQRQPEPEPEAEPEPEPASEPEGPAGPLPDAFELGLGVRVQMRDFSYNDPLVQLPEHSLDPTPAARLGLRFYPAALATDGFAANLGIAGHVQMMWPVDVTGPNGVTFETTQQAFGVALRLRLPLGEPGGSELGAELGYAASGLKIADSNAGADPGVPSVSYAGPRIGLDGRVALSESIKLELAVAYLVLSSIGEVGERAFFPHASGGGLEAELAASFVVADPIALRAGLGLSRYFLSFEPRPSDPGVVSSGRIAGGAVDQTLYGLVGLQLQL